jgi:integrase
MSGGAEKRKKAGAMRSVRLLAPLARGLGGVAEDDRAAIRPRVPAPECAAWTDDDWRNWRHRVFQANADAIGKAKTRPYDLRHSFVSLLIAEDRTVIDIAQQAGHSAETCLRYYAHLFAELDPERRVPRNTRSERRVRSAMDAQRTRAG